MSVKGEVVAVWDGAKAGLWDWHSFRHLASPRLVHEEDEALLQVH